MLVSIRLVICSRLTGDSGFMRKSWIQRISTPSGTSRYSQRMFMYSNQPVSTRYARTVRVTGSAVRSDTQDQALPSSSGCIVKRKRTVSPSRWMISALAYSLKRFGHDATSLVIFHTRSDGAEITIARSVCPAMISSPRPSG